MDHSAASGDAESKEVLVTIEADGDNLLKDDIFTTFHEQYLELTSINKSSDNKQIVDCRKESKQILESMIGKLNNIINGTAKEHKFYLRLFGMRMFLHHILTKYVDQATAIDFLEKIYKEMKPYLINPEIVYSGFLIMNSLASLIQKSNSLEKIKDILEECQSVYTTFKQSSNPDNIYSGKELFSNKKEIVPNKEANLKFEKLVITNLLFLGSVYEKLGNHFKDIVCYHTAFSRMLSKGLVSPFKWVDFTTRLACVFIDDNNFKDARHHLAAATHVHEILEEKLKSTNDSLKELMKDNAIHLALAWVRYCVLLFERSKDEDRTKFVILYKNGYLCPNNKFCSDKTNLNDQYEDFVMGDRNAVFQNQRFIDTIDKELVDYDNERFDEYADIVKEKNIGFGEVLNEIEKQKNKGDCETPSSSVEKCNIVPTDDFIKNEVQENTKKLKDEDIKSLEQSTENNDSLNKIEDHDNIKENKSPESNTETINVDNTKLEFTSLGYLPIENTVTKDLIQNPEDAKKLFTYACSWSKQAQMFYPKTTDFYSYVHVILNMVSLYRLCAYFQGRDNLEYRLDLEQKRENLLEQLVGELSEIQPENHLHVRLYQEMALLNIDLAMLNMCNIYNIQADDTYKLCALAEIQSHISHTYIVGDMLEKSTEITDQENCSKENDIKESVDLKET